AWVANAGGISQLGLTPQGEELRLPEHSGAVPSGIGGPPTPISRMVASLPAQGIVSGLDCRPGSRWIGFTFSGSRHASDCYTGVPDSNLMGNVDRWTSSEAGGLDSSPFVEPRRVEYPSFDQRKIPAFVYTPPSRKSPGPPPVLIDIHGGPEGQTRPG